MMHPIENKMKEPAIDDTISSTTPQQLMRISENQQTSADHSNNLDSKQPIAFILSKEQFVNSTKSVGLINLGNTCFLNAVIQQFNGFPDLKEYLFNYNGDNVFLIEFRELLFEMSRPSNGPVSPFKLIKVLINWDGSAFNCNVQQDASELVLLIIDKLLSITPKETFNGTLIYHIDGVDEDYHTKIRQSFTILSVPISNQSFCLNDCLDSFHNEEHITYFAELLKKKISATQKANFSVLPYHLIIQLNRFQVDPSKNTYTKLNCPIFFPNELDMSQHLDQKIENQTKMIYILSGVIIHRGSANFGHYYSYVRNRTTGEWHIFDDTMAETTTINQIFHDSNQGNKNAYMLFYDRK